MAEPCDAAEAPSQVETCAAGAEPAVMLRALSGEVFAELRPVPATIADVKAAVEASKDVPSALQKVMLGDEVLEEGYKFDGTSMDLTSCSMSRPSSRGTSSPIQTAAFSEAVA